MDDEDTQDIQNSPASDVSELKSDLQRMQEQLSQMNQSYQQQMQSMVDAITKSNTQTRTSDEYLTDEEKQLRDLKAEIENLKQSAPRQTQEILKKERDLNNTVVKLASEYPEIQSDAKMRQAVLDQHAKLPQGLRETAEGYELAVQRAVAQAGIVPKSKRSEMSQNADDFSSPGQRSGRSAQAGAGRKAKVSEKTLFWSQLLGRDITDEKVLRGLEEAANRDSYKKYR